MSLYKESKRKLPFGVRVAIWLHQVRTGHRITKVYKRGKYRHTHCCSCDRTFHYRSIGE